MIKRSGWLCLLVWGIAVGCSEDTLVSIGTVTDEFKQNASASIDVLWVVDNSDSMDEEQNALGFNFIEFINELTASQVDYHIGVISTDTDDGGICGGAGLHYAVDAVDASAVGEDVLGGDGADPGYAACGYLHNSEEVVAHL